MSRLKYNAIWIAVMVALFAASNTLLQIGKDGTTEHWVCLGDAFHCMAPSDVTPGAWWAGTFGTILMMVAVVCIWPWFYYQPKRQPTS
jgi:hypothetical protein